MTPDQFARLTAQFGDGELAELLGTDRKTVYRWRHGQRRIPSYVIAALEYRRALEELLLKHVLPPEAQEYIQGVLARRFRRPRR